MDHFVIYSEDNPAPTATTKSLSERLELDGHCIYINKAHFPILAEDNEPEQITVWIAEKPRTAIVEVTEPAYQLGSRFGVQSYA